MRLMNINYWAGKTKKDAVVMPIGHDLAGNMICLKSDKVTLGDIAKIRSNLKKLEKMHMDELKNWLSTNLASFKSALTTMKKGRFEVVSEMPING